jgi:hypothetical protein
VSELTDTLLDAGRALLEARGFTTRPGIVPSTDTAWLLAENDYFVIALVAVDEFATLVDLEPEAGLALMQLLRQAPPSAKTWDAYLVLMSATDASSPEDATAAIDIEHSLRGLRRVVVTGVLDGADVVDALQPFLPLPPIGDGLTRGVLEDLQAELVTNGIPSEVAALRIQQFQAQGALNDG